MHYLDVFAATYETETPTLTSGDVARLLAYDWPGNVRELRNVCERHVLAARRGAGSVDSALNDNRDSLEAPETLREAVAAFERQLIGKALARHQGRMDDVATGLGIGRRTLNEKIVKLGLDKETILNS
nr:helix-turn-helix domain-containing protein [Hoeflea alexandrii]